MNFLIYNFIRSAVISSGPKTSMQRNEVRDMVKKQRSRLSLCDFGEIGLKCGWEFAFFFKHLKIKKNFC